MPVVELFAAQIDAARQATLSTFADFAPAEHLYQPQAELNHPLWLLGHIATSEDHLILGFAGNQSALDDKFNKLFAIRSKPLTDASAYPAANDILAQMADIHSRTLAFVRALSPADLAAAAPGTAHLPPPVRERFGTVGRCIVGHIHHEATHTGQLAYIRRMLGRPFRV